MTAERTRHKTLMKTEATTPLKKALDECVKYGKTEREIELIIKSFVLGVTAFKGLLTEAGDKEDEQMGLIVIAEADAMLEALTLATKEIHEHNKS